MPERAENLPPRFWPRVLLITAAAIAATTYAALAIAHQVPMTWLIFAMWLAMLVCTNMLLIDHAWRHWPRVNIRRRIVLLLWCGIALWYWTVAPLYYWLTMNVDELQLAWTAFAFFWEVPGVGGGLFLTLCLAAFQPIHRALRVEAAGQRPPDEKKYVPSLVHYPSEVALLLFAVSLIGYLIGSWQLGFFAGWPLIEQIKNVVNGAVVALFLGVFFYLTIDVTLNHARRRLHPYMSKQTPHARSLKRRFAIITAVVAIGSIGLLGLVAFDAFQFVAEGLAIEASTISLLFNPGVVGQLIVGIGLVQALTIGVVVFAAAVITRALQQLTHSVILSETKNSALPLVLYTGDEIEVLSQSLASKISDLAGEKQRLEAIINSMAEGLIVTDQEERVVLVNQKATQILGWTSAELLGKTWHAVVRIANQAGQYVFEGEPPLHAALRQGRSVSSTDFLYTRRDGLLFPVSLSATALKREDGTITGGVLVFRDITREKEVERAREVFVSLVSHQLRTPLTIIQWYMEKLRRVAKTFTAQQRLYLNEIEGGSRRMVQLVHDLLNVSRLEMGRINITPEVADLTAVLATLVTEVQPLAERHGCTVRFVPPREPLPSVALDQRVVREALLNLLTNAIRYGGKDECNVTVSVEMDAHTYVISVADNGIGIPILDQPHVFERFFRAANATKVVAEGTGLGLHVAKLVIEAAGGRIWFTSKEGQGTTFYVSIPKQGMRKRVGDVSIADD